MIIPAIIAKDFEELKLKLSRVDGLVSWAQIDVMDGIFVPPKTWDNPADLENIRTAINLEAHLMVVNPENIIDAWLNSSVKRIMLHYESTDTDTLAGLFKKIVDSGKLCGIVLNLETPLWVLDFLLSNVKCQMSNVQLMAIAEIGYHGRPFDKKVLERIKFLREKYPDVIISVDGGVSLENARDILGAGADNIIVGSAIFKSGDIKKTIQQFSSFTKEV